MMYGGVAQLAGQPEEAIHEQDKRDSGLLDED
jgi:hypothetical protein